MPQCWKVRSRLVFSGQPYAEPEGLPQIEDGLPSFGSLLIVEALNQLFRAASHRRTIAADRVSKEEVGDRVADRTRRLWSRAWRRPRQVDQAVAAEPCMFGDHLLAKLCKAVEWKRLAGKLDTARGSPNPRAPRRRKSRFLTTLHSSLGVDVGSVLLGIGRAWKDEVGLPSAIVAVMADIDLVCVSSRSAGISSAPSNNKRSGLAASMSASRLPAHNPG